MVMEINSSELKRVQLFEVAGRVDSTNASELGAAMDRAADEGRNYIVLDLGGVEYMSSAGAARDGARAQAGQAVWRGPSNREPVRACARSAELQG